MGLGCLWVVRRLNSWYYEVLKLGNKRFSLPPGDLGWPYIGTMILYFRAFTSSNPDTFYNSYVSRYGKTGMYKALMFGRPTVIVTSAEACRKVMTDDRAFKSGWPASTEELVGKKSFVNLVDEEHKRMRKITSAPINGHEALSLYFVTIEENVKSHLEKWADMGEMEFARQLPTLFFRVIMHIFVSSEVDHILTALLKEYYFMNRGLKAMAINIPGFIYHRGLKARRRIKAVLQKILKERRDKRRDGVSEKRDVTGIMLDMTDENGEGFSDEVIIDILIMYLNAGYESTACVTLWTLILLHDHPDILKKAKAEQEEIVRNRPSDQKGLSFNEIRRMQYLPKVIDETLRLISRTSIMFREARIDFNVNGYIIPKGWTAMLIVPDIHMKEEVYKDPYEFNPSRWESITPKAGEYIPFGAGGRSCVGKDLAKLEITIFLHHFLLGYELQRKNPSSPTNYLPLPVPRDNCVGRIVRTTSSAPSA
nr:ent-kaurenoic acid oxidase 1 [Ipomoea batatas]